MPASYFPDWEEIIANLAPLTGYDPLGHLSLIPQSDAAIFDGYSWTVWTSEHWEIPLIAIVVYVLLLIVGQYAMSHRQEIKTPVILGIWSFSLSIFSAVGSYYTTPQLLFHPETGVISSTGGFYESVCGKPVFWGTGMSGLFVAFFIYSKVFELIDTVFLVLRKKPVILLHWYHHITVLLYCWHSYAVRIGTGQWFAVMNYNVHAIMYFYYGMTQCGKTCRALVKPIAPLITSLQLMQMVVGIIVTVASVVYTQQDKECYVNRTNSTLGLLMYTSYFVLFAQLFLHAYVFKKSKNGVKRD